jgi:HSP20 family protein
MATMQRDVNRMFDDNLRGWFGGREALTRWAPPVDVYEKEDEIVITAELPGMQQEDIEVEVHDGILSIRGEKKVSTEVNEDHYHFVERSYGSFERSFTLPAKVQGDNVKATYKDGVLKVHLPKAEEAKPKKISVSVDN